MHLSPMTPKQKTAKRALVAECNRSGSTFALDVSCGYATLLITAPAGSRFGGDLHEFVDTSYAPWHPDYQDALDRMTAEPPETCTDPDCEWCHEITDE